MPFSYSGDPTTSPKDEVRFLCQDTNGQDIQLQDAEINFLITKYTNLYRAAGYAARQIMAKYARQVDKSVGDLRLAYSQRQKAYMEIAKDLFRQANNQGSVPQAGGISKSDKSVLKLDPDAVKPHFTRDQFSFPGTATPADAVSDFGSNDENG